MARITVEDCLEHVENRFSLVLITAQRAKQLLKGARPRVEGDTGNKEIVIALREIGKGLIEYHEKDPEDILPDAAAEEAKRVAQARAAVSDPGELVAAEAPKPTTAEDVMSKEDELDDADLSVIGSNTMDEDVGEE